MTGPKSSRRRGPVPSLLGAIARPFYKAAINWRNHRFDSATNHPGLIRLLPIPVISVGNLSVGGTGKTPLVRWLAEYLSSERGGLQRPLIALRGYGQQATGGISDEAEEYRSLLPGVPLAIGADRFGTVQQALSASEGQSPTVVLLDDGFQHRQLARTFDLVLIDATRPPMGDALLPAGWLREEMSSLRRAHAVVVTRSSDADPLTVAAVLTAARQANPALVTAVTSHALTLPATADNQRVMVVSGIGNPEPFTRAVRALASVVGVLEFEDHAPYGPKRVLEINRLAQASGATVLVTTGKDAAKLNRLAPGTLRLPVVAAGLSLRFEQGEQALCSAMSTAIDAARPAHSINTNPA